MKFILATNNEHKKDEFISYLKKYNIDVLSLKDVNINVDPEENGKTFEENAFIKANEVKKICNEIIIADDSGLQIHSLNNFPGIYSSRFLEGKPYIEKFIEINKMLLNKEDRSANFNCTLCVIGLESKPLYFVGKVNGIILEKSSGKEGFGYDPIFYYPPLQKTFAELSQEEKNQISHRGNAIKELISYLKEKKYI